MNTIREKLTLRQACENVIWKLNRCEVSAGKIIDARIDRKDIVIRDLIKALQEEVSK